jgi:hypothetical protein
MLLTINLDTDDNTGGPKACQYLLNLAEAVIRRNSNWLFEQGYEQVKVTPNFAELPNKEGAIALYRGSITVSAVIYPRIYED